MTIKNLTGAAKLVEATRLQHGAAMQKYNRRYVNTKYVAAVREWMDRYHESDFYSGPACDFGMSLGDTALALCGSPHHTADLSTFAEFDAAVSFLLEFID